MAKTIQTDFDPIDRNSTMDQFLKDNQDLSLEILAEMLQRPTSEIRRRRQNLGIFRNTRIMNLLPSL
ncbi:hypothetical protein [Aquirhabdus parva]|uniref:Uncharacterized protein n=1 Tax=Aquirhabdus parva TaxID=2283318 RepID=A0A345P6A6_9GAMM|nr:hypothetical protein [Aquirhabdus parva]AXI02815.1 hypothetical protein HYN46_08185 [Aquirhabdus parva]